MTAPPATRPPTLREAAQAVLDAYYYCRDRNSMSGFWTHIDDLAKALSATARETAARCNGRCHCHALPEGIMAPPCCDECSGEPRCKTCGGAGYVMAYDQIEPGISAPSGEPCPDCDGPPAALTGSVSPSPTTKET